MVAAGMGAIVRRLRYAGRLSETRLTAPDGCGKMSARNMRMKSG